MKLVSIEADELGLASLMEEAQHDRIIVEQNGRPVGVILSLEEYYGTLDSPDDLEIRELLSSPELHLKIQRADAAYAAGGTLSHELVGERLQARIIAGG